MDFSSSSSSCSDGNDDSASSDDDRRHNKSSKKSKDSKKKKSSRSKSKSRKEKKHKKSSRRHRDSDDKKRRKEKKDRKRKDRDSSDHDSSSEPSRREHKRSRKERKSRKRSKKEKERDSRDRSINGDENDDRSPPVDTRSTNLARALNTLLGEHPPMASELPLILIRLAGGTTMDLRHMTDTSAAHGLQNVLSCLQPFGVNEEDHVWSFSTPAMQQQLGSRQRRDELVLLRVVRSLLDEVGINLDTVSKYETSPTVDESAESSKAPSSNQGRADTEPPPPPPPPSHDDDSHENLRKAMKERTMQFLMAFHDQDASLGQQLAGLCATIANGESVSIDGIPDEKLKDGLSSLFEACGLEKSEMDDDDDDDDDEDDDDDDGPTYGYGLPNGASSNDVNLRIAAVMEACSEKPKSRRMMGPMRGTPEDIEQANALPIHEPEEDDEEDEGPMLPGAVQRGPTLPPELIKAQAERRQLELKATAAGVEIPKTDASGREEWILLPGKHDFLSGIKTGQAATQSRGFQNKKVESKDEEVVPIHPAVQRELDKIMQAHDEARGPSLMDQHRDKRTKEKEAAAAAAANGGRGKKNFNWSRDKDLDEGRRVDKDALRMVLGGAADGLKTKFQGGLNH